MNGTNNGARMRAGRANILDKIFSLQSRFDLKGAKKAAAILIMKPKRWKETVYIAVCFSLSRSWLLGSDWEPPSGSDGDYHPSAPVLAILLDHCFF